MKEKIFVFFKKNKKLLLIVAAVILCLALALGGWLIFGGRNEEPTNNNVTEEGYDENISVEDAIKKGYFPAHVLDELSVPADSNTLPDKKSKKVLGERRIRYEFEAGGQLKAVVVDDVKLATKDFDTMTVRIRSLTEDNFDIWRLYLKTSLTAKLTNGDECLAFDSTGINKEAFKASKPDKDGWITLTIELNKMAQWNDSKKIFGFSLGVSHNGAMFEIKDIRFTNEGKDRVSLKQEAADVGSVADGIFTPAILNELSYHTWNFDPNDTTSSKELKDTGIRYKTTRESSAALKGVVVKGFEMEAKKFNKMTVKIRSISMQDFTRWRFFLVTDKGGKMAVASDKVIDSVDLKAALINASEPDKDGWITLTIDVGALSQWKEAKTIKGFAIGYINTGTTIEIEEIKFTYVPQPKPVVVTDGNITPKILNTNSYEMWNKVKDDISGKSMSGNALRYTTSHSGSAALKTVVIESLNMKTANFDTVTIKMRSVDKTEFQRLRLYIMTDKGGNMTGNPILETAEGTNTSALKMSSPDKNGWFTMTFDLSNIKQWKSATTLKSFGIGYVNIGNAIEIASVKFTKEKATVAPPEPTVVTDGNFTKEILYSNSEEIWNKDEEDTSAKELLSTGLKYTSSHTNSPALKIVQVKSADMKTADFDTVTVKMRSVDKKEFERLRFYMITDKGGSLTGDPILETVEGTNISALKMSSPDKNGWFTMTFDLSNIKQWKSATTLKSFAIGYVNIGNAIEIESVKFTKEKATVAPSEPTVVTDGNFTKEILYSNSEEIWNKDENDLSAKEVLSTGMKYTSGHANSPALKIVQVKSADMNTADFDTMTVKIRSVDGKAFQRWRLYLVTDKGGSLTDDPLLDSTTGGSINMLDVSDKDADGWITLTFDVGLLQKWKDADKLTAFGLGYVNSGNAIEIASIKFTDEGITVPAGPTVVTDGNFTPAILNTNSEEIWNKAENDLSKKEVLSTGIKYTTGHANSPALKIVQVKSVDMKTEDFDIMTVKIRSVDGKEFQRWRLYLQTDKGGSLKDDHVLETMGVSGGMLDVSAADAQGWITLTVNLAGLQKWTQADKLVAFGIGYVNSGNAIEIASIQFTENGLSEDAEMQIANGSFPADVLIAAGKPVKDNNVSDKTPTQMLQNGVVKYNFGESLALKSIQVSGLNLATSNYGSLVVKLRSETDFERFRLYLMTNKGGSLVSSPLVDTAKNLNSNLVTVSAADAEGWITVTIKVSQLDAWKSASSVTGFAFGFVNEGATQEIADIHFTKKNTSFTAQEMFVFGTGLYGNSALAEIEKVLNSSSVKLTYDAAQTSGLKSICVENLEIDTATCNKLTLRIRSLDNKAFTNYRLYLLTSAGGALSANEVINMDPATNATALTASEPDADGWITIEINLKDLAAWSGVLKGFNFGWMNEGAVFEVADVEFSYEATQPTNVAYTYDAQALNASSKFLYNNSFSSLATKALTADGIAYTSTTGGGLKNIIMQGISLDTTKFDTMTVRLRSTSSTNFTRWRLYLVSDSSDLGRASKKALTTQLTEGRHVIDTNDRYPGLVSVSAADANGWITVTMNLGDLPDWANAGNITDFGFGFVNNGPGFEVKDIVFTNEAEF